MLMTEVVQKNIIDKLLSTERAMRLKRHKFNQDDTPIKICNNSYD